MITAVIRGRCNFTFGITMRVFISIVNWRGTYEETAITAIVVLIIGFTSILTSLLMGIVTL